MTTLPKKDEAVVAEFIEKGADIEHTRWSKWQEYFFSKCIVSIEQDYVTLKLPTALFSRWKRQIATPYAELSEDEKESDRREVRSYLLLLSEILTAKNAEIEEARREIPTFKQFKDFLAENCVDGRKYLDGKYDRKIYKFLNPDPLPTKE